MKSFGRRLNCGEPQNRVANLTGDSETKLSRQAKCTDVTSGFPKVSKGLMIAGETSLVSLFCYFLQL